MVEIKQVAIFGVLLLIFLSGCTSSNYSNTQTEAQTISPTSNNDPNANLQSQLSDAITTQINSEKYVLYLEISNVNINDQKASISYATYEAATDNAIYGQMVKIIKIIVDFFNTKSQKIETISLDTIDRANNTYKATLTWDEAVKYSNGDLGLTDLEKSQSKTIPQAIESQLITGELSSFLPSRSDLSTEWALDKVQDFGADESKGIVKQLLGGMRKDPQVPIDVYLYQFDTSANAEKFMTDELIPIKDQGGYKELDVSKYGSDCYGTNVQTSMAEFAKIRCVKKNVYIRIEGQGLAYMSTVSDTKTIADIVIPKVE